MDAASHSLSGSCHCGAIQVTITATKPASELQVRACQCGFCRRQGAMTISDPAGRAVIEIAAGAMQPYAFGTRTATSLLCRHCGVYAGAYLWEGAHAWSIANVRGLAIPGFEDRAGEPMHYEHETADQRVARRKQRWTPTEIRFKL
ncbi:MAG: hypothetical protein R3D68_02380 [Hyphomicrobiaceae bacterium]